MDGTWTARPTARFWRAGAIASTFAALMVGAFLVVRRLTGDVSSSLAVSQLIPTAAILVAWAWLVRLAFKDCVVVDRLWLSDRLIRTEAVAFLWLPVIAVLCFAVALSFPGARFMDWFVWLAALALILPGPSHVLPAWQRPRFRRCKPAEEFIVQDLKRYRTASGQEFVRGTLAAEFAAGQRTAIIYAAFCPPFEHLPQVEPQVAGKTASVKVAQVLHNGVQLEVRLPREALRGEIVNVQFMATDRDVAR